MAARCRILYDSFRWLPRYLAQRAVRRPTRGRPSHVIMALADHFEPSILPDRPGRYAEMPEQERRLAHWCREYPGAVGRWRSEMSPRDQRIFAALAGAELEQHGYAVSPGPAAPITPRQERWFHYHNELMRNVNFMRLRIVQERGRELRFALARRLRDPVKRAGT